MFAQNPQSGFARLDQLQAEVERIAGSSRAPKVRQLARRLQNQIAKAFNQAQSMMVGPVAGDGIAPGGDPYGYGGGAAYGYGPGQVPIAGDGMPAGGGYPYGGGYGYGGGYSYGYGAVGYPTLDEAGGGGFYPEGAGGYYSL